MITDAARVAAIRSLLAAAGEPSVLQTDVGGLAWADVLEAVGRRRRPVWRLLAWNTAGVALEESTLRVVFDAAGALDSFVSADGVQTLTAALQNLGVQWSVEAEVAS